MFHKQKKQQTPKVDFSLFSRTSRGFLLLKNLWKKHFDCKKGSFNYQPKQCTFLFFRQITQKDYRFTWFWLMLNPHSVAHLLRKKWPSIAHGCPSLITSQCLIPPKQGSHDAWTNCLVCSKTSSFESILKDDPLPMLSGFDRFSPATWNSMCFVGGVQRRSSKEHPFVISLF